MTPAPSCPTEVVDLTAGKRECDAMSLISGFSALVAASLLSGQTVPTQERPEALTRLMACRPIADSAARLACFDAAAGALDTA